MTQDNLPDTDTDRIAFQQILEADHSVFSIQTVVIPPGKASELNSDNILQLYFDYIERFTCGLIRTEENPDGIEFRLAGTGTAIISFAPRITEENGNNRKITLRISGGLLVQPEECDRGQLDIIVESVPTGTRVTLKLSDYCPLLLGSSQPSLWRKWLYRLTQAYLHKIVTVRFLSMVYRKMTGNRLSRNLVNIAVRQGKNT